KRLASACCSHGARGQSRSVSRRSLLHGALLGGVAVVASAGAGLDDSLVGHRLRAAPLPQGSSRTLTLVTNRAPSDLDPHSAYDAGSGVLLRGPFEGLIGVRANTTDEFVPVLAESWEASADESVWTFRLRDGVTFQDGTPLDAPTARESFERLLTLGLAPSTVLGRFLTDPAQVSAPDRLTLVFDLGRPQPLFETALASAYGTAIVNTAALRDHEVDGDWGHAWAQTSSAGLGTGPYRLVEFDVEMGAVLERYDGYWRGWEGEHFDEVILRVVEPETRRALIESGDADIATTLPLATVGELERHPDLAVDHRSSLVVRYIAMTVAGPLQAPEARQALCWAFPYDEVISGVYDGFAKRAIGPIAELCRGFSSDTFVYQTELERARALLDRAEIVEGTVLTMLLPPGNTETAVTAELFQANLAAVGLTLDIRPVDFATYVGIFSSDLPAEERPNLLPSFWSPDYNDGWNHLWPQISCDAWQSGNGGHYCNERVEELLERARNAAGEESYLSSLKEIQQIVTRDDPAAIYYAQPEWLTVLRRDIEGFTPDPVVGDLVDFYALHRREPEGVA
ncbi:MAG: extracellular solute-binding protein family 5, partial [Thermomicrobiales bacterium]|nr:extracellular solute-binding protein family 5 [Thermomicrobiales bacterium]